MLQKSYIEELRDGTILDLHYVRIVKSLFVSVKIERASSILVSWKWIQTIQIDLQTRKTDFF